LKIVADGSYILGQYLLPAGTIGTPDNPVAQVVNQLMLTTTKHTVQEMNIDSAEMGKSIFQMSATVHLLHEQW